MTRPPHLLVIDPAMTSPEAQGARAILNGWPGTSRILLPALRPGDLPEGYEADGVVLMGSRASVHENHAWMHDLDGWLDPILTGAVRLPLFGICFGHQLIAAHAGAPVGKVHADGHKEAGYRETIVEGSRLLPGEHRLRVVVSHFEQVVDAPEGYRAIAHREGIPIDGLEHERLPIFSFQFHPEGREDFARKCSLDPAGIDDRLRADCGKLLAAFRDMVLKG